MSDLAEFLLARIAEDEECAREALLPDIFNEDPQFYSPPGPMRDDWGCWVFHVPVPRVLAECEVKRAILALHASVTTGVYAKFDTCVTCCEDDGIYSMVAVSWPCLTLRALAKPYADHPDYREEWQS